MITNYSKLIGMLFSLLIIVSLNPIYVWGYYKFALSIITFITLIGFSLYSFRIGKLKFNATRCLLIVLIVIYNYLLGMSFEGIIVYTMPIIILFFSSNNLIVSTVDILKKIYCILILPAILLWIIHHFSQNFTVLYLGQVPDHLNPSALKATMNENYSIFPFTVTLDYMHRINGFYRLIGFFDEPGLTGTFAFFLLATSGYKLNTKTDKIIFISGLLSLSLAFYVLTIMFIFLNNIGSIKRLSSVLLGGMIVLIVIYNSPILSQAIGSRLQLNHDNNEFTFQGDNRSGLTLNSEFLTWKQSDIKTLLFGDRNYRSSDGSSSWKMIAIQAGLVGISLFVFIIMLSISLYSNKKLINKSNMIFLLCLLASFYQRPDMIKIFYLLMLVHYVLYDNVSKSKVAN